MVHGSDTYLKDQAIAQVKQQVLGDDPDPLACSQFDPDAPLSEVFDELRTLPLLTAHRLVTVAPADEFVRKHRAALERYCTQPSTSAGLLLICNTFDGRTRLYRAVQKIGSIVKCDPPKGAAIDAWIVRQSSTKYDKRMDARTASMLRRLAGDALAALDSELLKLSIYVGERDAITAPDVDALIGRNREEKVFGIADALARRDASRALDLWAQAWLTERSAPARAVGGLAWALRRNLDAKNNALQGASYTQLARTLWKDPREVQRLLEGTPLEAFEHQVLALLRADMSVKFGLSRTLHSAVEKLIVALCALPQAS